MIQPYCINVPIRATLVNVVSIQDSVSAFAPIVRRNAAVLLVVGIIIVGVIVTGPA